MNPNATINVTNVVGATISGGTITDKTITATLSGGAVGPQGPTGPTGPTGPQGPTGPASSPATFTTNGTVKQTVYNVRDYGAVGNGVTDDTSAIQSAMTAAGASGGQICLAPGAVYLISSPLLWEPTFTSTQQTLLAPSIIGQGRGATPDKGTTPNVTTLLASSTFPVGEFMIDYIGGSNTDQAISGFTVKGLTIRCQNRAAGIRAVNQLEALWSQLLIINAATPNPANTIGSPTAAFNFIATPTYNSYNNNAEKIYVYHAAQDSFFFNEGTGSYVFADTCESVNAGRYGYNAGSYTTLTKCNAQGSTSADYYARGDSVWIGCVEDGPPHSNAVLIPDFGNSPIFIGCSFQGTNISQAESAAALIYVGQSTGMARFEACSFATGQNTSEWAWINSSNNQCLQFIDSSFSTYYGALTVTAFQINKASNFQPTFTAINCPGINPNCFYKAPDASGTETISRASGNYITIYQNGNMTVVLPAALVFGDTMTLDITPNGYSQTWPSNLVLNSPLTLTSETLLTISWNGTNWMEVSRSNPIQGLSLKTTVVAVATSNVSINSGLPTVDGVTLSANQRLLLTDQTISSQNGIWLPQTTGTNWTRPTDFMSASSQTGVFTFVEVGSNYSGTGWILTGSTPVIVDTSSQTWVQFGSAPTVYISRSINSVSSNTTAGAAADTDYVYLVSGATTLTLPSAVGNTNRYSVKNVDSNIVTTTTTSSQTIDGSSTVTLPVANTSVDIISDGTNWRIL